MFKVGFILVLALSILQVGAVDGEFSGEYRLRFAGQNSASDFSSLLTDDAEISGRDMRAKISGAFRPSEAFEGSSSLYSTFNAQGSDIQMYAHGDWLITDEFMIRAGRSVYKIGDGSVISSNNYEDYPNYFDGVFLSHSSESLGADLALAYPGGSYHWEGQGSPAVLLHLTARSFPELLNKANIHFIAPLSSEWLDHTQTRAGVTVGGGMSGVHYRATVAASSVTNPSMDNLLFEMKAGYSFEMDHSTAKIYLGYHLDGAQYDPFMYDRHKNAGKLDIVRWGGGLSYIKGGLSYWLGSDYGFGLVGYYFLTDQQQSIYSPVSSSIVQETIDAASSMAAQLAGASPPVPPELVQTAPTSWSRGQKGDMEIDVFFKAHIDSSVLGKVWSGLYKSKSGQYHAKIEGSLMMKF